MTKKSTSSELSSRPAPLCASAHFNQQPLQTPLPSRLPEVALLPNTNLAAKLPAVQHQPPRYFSVKDHHLLKPPVAMQTQASLFGRRASDGGAHVRRAPDTSGAHPPPPRHVSDSGTGNTESTEQTDEQSSDSTYNNNLCRCGHRILSNTAFINGTLDLLENTLSLLLVVKIF
nr:uncharacterized protein LOC116778597 [Danaus plexippus plexippus]